MALITNWLLLSFLHSFWLVFTSHRMQTRRRRSADSPTRYCVLRGLIRTYPDFLVIVLGDFNKGNLSHELPKYKQFIKCPTREGNILDHCYTNITGAYHAAPRAALGPPDSCMRSPYQVEYLKRKLVIIKYNQLYYCKTHNENASYFMIFYIYKQSGLLS